MSKKISKLFFTRGVPGTHDTKILFQCLNNLKIDKFKKIDIPKFDKSIDDSNKIRSSTGVAASWLSPLGPMTFILSTNLSKASTDTTESFNFNLGTTF